MNLPSRLSRSIPHVAVAAVALVAFAAAAHAQDDALPLNVTAGGKLRPGVYGRIAVQGVAPPAVIYGHPMIAKRNMVAVAARPSYLYVPPGQVRKWAQHCHKWQACEEPVLFVRVDESPGRWGNWKALRAEPVAFAD
jgi:hypothetical protein